MQQGDSILLASRVDLWHKAQERKQNRPADDREFKGILPGDNATPVYFLSSQFGVVPARSQSARDIGRLKDTTENNRKTYQGDAVILESRLSAKRKRTQLENTRL